MLYIMDSFWFLEFSGCVVLLSHTMYSYQAHEKKQSYFIVKKDLSVTLSS